MLDRLKKMLSSFTEVGAGANRERSPTDARGVPNGLAPKAMPHEREDSKEGYFETMTAMQTAISKRDYASAAEFARRNMRHIPDFITHTRREWGAVPPSIPALEHGGTMLALVGDRDGLLAMRRLVERAPELAERRSSVDAHIADLDLFAAIVEAVRNNPGCLQTSVKQLVCVSDGRRVSNLIGWLEKAGRIRRTKNGSTYGLTLAGGPQETSAPPPRSVAESHRRGSKAMHVRTVDLEQLPYVSLPRAPLCWEERQGGRVPEPVADATEQFEVRAAPGWTLQSSEKIPMRDRPDPAFRKCFSVNDGLFLVDDLGKAAAYPNAPASAVRYDRFGREAASAPLLHDIYRMSSNPLGVGLVAMSRECVLHAYDDLLRPIIETALTLSPEVRALASRLGIESEFFKTFLRSVALSHDTSRYLVTGVDEAWCISTDGLPLWGIRLPLKAGWTQVAGPAGEIGTTDEITEALATMGLRLPVSAEEIKKRYRDLAKVWHPDLHPREAEAGERMKALNNAAELLTGVDTAALPHYTRPLFEKVMASDTFGANGIAFSISMGMTGGETDAADWIYAAAFASRSHGAFLAGYSGRVVQVDDEGRPIRVYDIGSVPRAIADTGDYLYILTDTRLYVLKDDVLHAIVDTFDGGELIMGQTGFALIENKRLRWFREDGRYVGSVVTRQPIRRAYHTGAALVIETRQQRALIDGAPHWWEDAGRQ